MAGLQDKGMRVSGLKVPAVVGLQEIAVDVEMSKQSYPIAGNHSKLKGAIAVGDEQLLALQRLQFLASTSCDLKVENFKPRVDISKQR